MRTEPYQFVVVAGETSNELNVADMVNKTFEVSGLTSGQIVFEVLLKKVWIQLLTATENTIYTIDELVSKVRINATGASGAELEVHMLALNTRAE